MSSEETPVETSATIININEDALTQQQHQLHPITAAVTSTNGTTGAALAAQTSSINAPSNIIQLQLVEQNCRQLEDELQVYRENDARLKQQLAEAQRRERILVRRLAIKEQEVQDYATQVTELKASQAPGPAALRSALLDPAVNILFQKLKGELQATRARLEETQNELSAWKFTPDSNTGKRLMAKCRLLYTENEELGKMTSNGRLAKLEGDLALQKSFSEEVKKSQSELDDILQELDEDVEGMQSTILFLQQELKAAKDTIVELERQAHLTGGGVSATGDALISRVDVIECIKQEPQPLTLTNGGVYAARLTDPEHIVGGVINKIEYQSGGVDGVGESHETSERTTIVVTSGTTTVAPGAPSACLNLSMNHKKMNERTTLKQKILSNLNNSNISQINGIGVVVGGGEQMAPVAIPNNSNNGNAMTTIVEGGVLNLAGKNGTNKRNFRDSEDDEESSEDDGVPLAKSIGAIAVAGGCMKVAKKARRSSVLSIDLNEEDSQLVIGHEETTRPLPGNGTVVVGGDVGSKA